MKMKKTTEKKTPPPKKKPPQKAQLEIYNLSLLKIFLGDRFINHICKKQIIKVKERTIEKSIQDKKKKINVCCFKELRLC